MIFVIFNESISEYSQLFSTFLNIFNMYDLLMNYSNKDKITQNLLISSNYFAYNFVIYTCIFCIGFILIATFLYMFREASAIEINDCNDEIMQGLNGLAEGLEKLTIKKRENSINVVNDVKQVIWLCLTGSSDLYNKKVYSSSRSLKSSEENKFLLFKNSAQIISFFKYLFAIKPKMQFKRLENNFVILIECKNESVDKEFLSENDLDQILYLLDWLNFAGCKIPLAIFTRLQIEKHLRMNMKNNYLCCRFINEQHDLDIFLNLSRDYSSPKCIPIKGIGFNKKPQSNEEKKNEANKEFAIKIKKLNEDSINKENNESGFPCANSSDVTNENE